MILQSGYVGIGGEAQYLTTLVELLLQLPVEASTRSRGHHQLELSSDVVA